MLVKRIVFTVRRKSNPSLGVGRLFETITVKMTNGETKAGADRLAQEIAYALEEHFDEPSSIKWELDETGRD